MIEVDNKQDLDAELAKSKRVIALFYAQWCPHCVRFVPIFNRKIATLPKVDVVHVLMDDFDSPLWDDFSVDAVPTIILFENGVVCSRLDGRLGLGLSESAFLAWLEKIKNGFG